MASFLLIFVLFTAVSTNAEEPAAPQVQKPWIKRKTTSTVRGLTDRIDDLFGTERSDENRRFSTLRLSGRHTIVDSAPSETTYNVRLMLKPATFQNWSAQLDRWAKRKKGKVRDFVRTSKPESVAVAGEAREIDEDVSDEPEERDPWRFAFEQRFRLDRDNFFDGRIKIAKDIEWGNSLHHVVYDVRWSTQRQWESVLSAISSYSITDTLLFQFSNAFSWWMTARNLESSHGPSLAYTISPNKAVSVAFTAAVGTDPWWANAYTISSTYRQHIYEEWIDISISPYQSYARSRNFQAETGIVLSAEVVF